MFCACGRQHARELRMPICDCGRRHINGGRQECSACRRDRERERAAARPLCNNCGERRPQHGNELCFVCLGQGYGPCAICGQPSKGDTCRPCSATLKQDDRRRRVAQRLYKLGWGISEIGRRLGVSRQRADQLIRHDAHKSNKAVHKALRTGRLTKPAACVRCETFSPHLEAHHPDYSQPLAVEWLCVPCHNVVHPHYPGSRAPRAALPAREPQEASV